MPVVECSEIIQPFGRLASIFWIFINNFSIIPDINFKMLRFLLATGIDLQLIYILAASKVLLVSIRYALVSRI